MSSDEAKTVLGLVALPLLGWWLDTGSTPAWVCLNAVLVVLALVWLDEHSGRG